MRKFKLISIIFFITILDLSMLSAKTELSKIDQLKELLYKEEFQKEKSLQEDKNINIQKQKDKQRVKKLEKDKRKEQIKNKKIKEEQRKDKANFLKEKKKLEEEKLNEQIKAEQAEINRLKEQLLFLQEKRKLEEEKKVEQEKIILLEAQRLKEQKDFFKEKKRLEDEKKKEQIKFSKEKERLIENSPFFVYGGIGSLSLDSNYPDSDLLLEDGLGYYINDTLFLAIAYQYNFLQGMYITTTYASVNYKFNDVYLQPFLGIIIGEGTLNIYNDPITNIKVKEHEKKAISKGIQIGMEYNLAKIDPQLNQFGLVVTGQYIKHDLKIKVNNTEVKVDGQSNLILAIKYIF